MMFEIEVKISLKRGMLNPEAKTIENSIGILGYEIENTEIMKTIRFQMDEEDREHVREKVTDMCERLLCNPTIHKYKIRVIPIDTACGVGQ